MTQDKEAAYTALSQETVRALHKQFQNGLEQKARKALPADTADADGLVEALKALQAEAVRKGITIKADELAALAARGLEAVNGKREKIESRLHVRAPKWSRYRSPRLSARQERQIAAAAMDRRRDERVEKVFGGKDRIYLRLQGAPQMTETRRTIEACLAAKGYGITDYNKGYATDAAGKQQFKIGKLLKEEKDLYRLFVNDSSRGLENLLVVLSRNPMDIARMSTGRPWSSCMGAGGFNWRYVPRDVRQGTMVAYLVSEKDPDILAPLARMLVKPFSEAKTGFLTALSQMAFGQKGDAPPAPPQKIFVPYTAFGLRNPAFGAAVRDFVEKNFNNDKTGDFWLVSGLYKDKKPRHIVKKPAAPAGF